MLTQTLNEAKQVGLLYHFTSYDNLINILRNNNLGSGVVSPSTSFTRNKNLQRIYTSVEDDDYGKDMSCCIVVNGDKLSNNYKIKPYNFYDSPDVDDYMVEYWKEAFNTNQLHGHPEASFLDEAEEVVMGNVKNIKAYIIKIILNSYDLTHGTNDTSTLTPLIDGIKKYSQNIPIVVKKKGKYYNVG